MNIVNIFPDAEEIILEALSSEDFCGCVLVTFHDDGSVRFVDTAVGPEKLALAALSLQQHAMDWID